jgi:hypothetical protein
MIAILNWSLAHWWVFFWLAIFGVFEAVRDFFLGIFAAVASIGERRHQRRVKELKLQAKIAAAPALPVGARKPGRCVHRNVRPVIAADDKLVGWLCQCDQQLPPDWAVREEDL